MAAAGGMGTGAPPLFPEAPLEGSAALPQLLGAFARDAARALERATQALARAIMTGSDERRRVLSLELHAVRQRAARLLAVVIWVGTTEEVRACARARARGPPRGRAVSRALEGCRCARVAPLWRPGADVSPRAIPMCHAQVGGCSSVQGRLHAQREALTHAADALFFAHGQLEGCRAPLYAVPDALMTLAGRTAHASGVGSGTGGPVRAAPRPMLPSVIEEQLLGAGATTSAAAFAARSRRRGSARGLLLRAERELRKRLRREDLPMRASVVEVKAGRVHVVVDGEFEMQLGLMLVPNQQRQQQQQTQAQGQEGVEDQQVEAEALPRKMCWRVLRIDMRAGSQAGALAPTISAAHRAQLLRAVDGVLATAPAGAAITRAVDMLHACALALVIDRVVFRQAQALRDGPWKGRLRVERLGADSNSDGGAHGDGVRVRYWLGAVGAGSALALARGGASSGNVATPEPPAVVVYATDEGDLAARLEPSPDSLVGAEVLAIPAEQLSVSMLQLDLMALLSRAMAAHAKACLQALHAELRDDGLVCAEESDLAVGPLSDAGMMGEGVVAGDNGSAAAPMGAPSLSFRACGQSFASVSLDILSGRYTVRPPAQDGELLQAAVADAEAALRAGRTPPAEVFLRLRTRALRANLEAAATSLGLGVVGTQGGAAARAAAVAAAKDQRLGADPLVLAFVDAAPWYLVVGETAPHSWPPAMALVRGAAQAGWVVVRLLNATSAAQVVALAVTEGEVDAGHAHAELEARAVPGLPSRLLGSGVARRVMSAISTQCRMLIKEAVLTEQLKAHNLRYMTTSSWSGASADEGATEGDSSVGDGHGSLHFHFTVPSVSANTAAAASQQKVVVAANLDSSLSAGWEVTMTDDYFADLWREHKQARSVSMSDSFSGRNGVGAGSVALTPTGLRFSYSSLHERSLADFLAQYKSVQRLRYVVLGLTAAARGCGAPPAGGLEILPAEVWPQRAAFTLRGTAAQPVRFEALSKLDGSIALRSSPELPGALMHLELMLRRKKYDALAQAIQSSVPLLLALLESGLCLEAADARGATAAAGHGYQTRACVVSSVDSCRLIFGGRVLVDLHVLPSGGARPAQLDTATAQAATAQGLRELPTGALEDREWAISELPALLGRVGAAAASALAA